ncbi:MAG: carboxypeptidase-like regulatory domain-containing protein, partial [Pyrinomonadaceae bacterium]
MNRIGKTIGLLMLAGIFVFSVSGQEITGSIVGTVTDSTGAVVPGANVRIADQAKGDLVVRTVTTNSAGEFSAPNVAPGIYKISVEAAGFK